MLRYALGRILWTLPVVFVLSLLLFALLSRLPQADDARQMFQRDQLPTFVNLHPPGIDTRVGQAVAWLAQPSSAHEGAALLSRLGGAGLPHVLPKLDSFEPEHRRRIAVALEPVAQRMGLISRQGFDSPDAALTFWTQFWLERHVDFKPMVVRRAVRRLALHGSDARRTQLIELDTYALGALIEGLGEVKDAQDVARISRFLDVASHVTGRGDGVAAGASVEETRRAAKRWRGWWLEARSDFEELSGARRFGAVLLETRYGRWAMLLATEQLGHGPDGESNADVLLDRGPPTLLLALLGLLLGYGVAVPLGLVAAYRARGWLDRAGRGATLVLLATPVPVIVALIATVAPRWAAAVALVAIAVGFIGAPLRQQRVKSLDVLSEEHVRAARARGLSVVRLLAVHVARTTALSPLTLLGVDLPLALSAACVAEVGLHLPGIGPDVVRAATAHDVPFLMAFGLCAALVTALFTVALDVLCARLDPRARRRALQQVS